ncbi:MAG: hypothetical protein JSV01_08730 [Desulfobacterales bacterium]|nr:MAG: hypothetical protein JSV01_08730 [Desulfobacterales bacterium]
MQPGAQKKTVNLVFGQDEAPKKFRVSSGWKAGVDGSVALVELGAGGSINTTNVNDPIIGFIFSQQGLVDNLMLEGSKFTRRDKRK